MADYYTGIINTRIARLADVEKQISSTTDVFENKNKELAFYKAKVFINHMRKQCVLYMHG